MNTQLTPNEKELLLAIVNSEYQDGDTVIDYPVWSDCLQYDCISLKRKAISGTMSSLVKKGLAEVNDHNENTCWITSAGYELIKDYIIDRELL